MNYIKVKMEDIQGLSIEHLVERVQILNNTTNSASERLYITKEKATSFINYTSNCFVLVDLGKNRELILQQAPINLSNTLIELNVVDIRNLSDEDVIIDEELKFGMSILEKSRISLLLRSNNVSVFIKGMIIDRLYLKLSCTDYSTLEKMFPLSKSMIQPVHTTYLNNQRITLNKLVFKEWELLE